MITEGDIPIEELINELKERAGTDIGAIVSFLGIVRGNGRKVRGMEVEVTTGEGYEREVERLKREAMERFHINAVEIVHRRGRLKVGDEIVLILVASEHRKDAFSACEFLIDRLKGCAYIKERELS